MVAISRACSSSAFARWRSSEKTASSASTLRLVISMRSFWRRFSVSMFWMVVISVIFLMPTESSTFCGSSMSSGVCSR